MRQWGAAMCGLAAGMLAACGAGAVGAAPEPAAYTGPIIDVHLHAASASANGHPPTSICVGISANLKYDPAEPWGQVFGRLAAEPTCENPIWGPMTDEEVMSETIAVMRRLNIRGVLSDAPGAVNTWREAAPELFIPARMFNLAYSRETPEMLGEAFRNGEFAVLGEVTNQYAGFLADHERFDAYWALAEELDIPLGIHMGVGPPGTPALTGGAYRLQSARQIEDVLARHPRLRVYMMHAGYPYAAETKAMLYAYPQLYVDTGILQASVPRADYHAFFSELVQAGFADRIMFGSDQMNWPGLIEEGINAINEAPYLTYEQKKAILHDNAARFLRLETE